MAIRYLNGSRVQRALQAGICRVVARREYINSINVFPVPDGDTGTNMAFTLIAIQQRTRDNPERNLDLTMQRVADAALDGSRGNSGAILAQFLQGLCEGCRNLSQVTAERFVDVVERGAKAAREAIAEPREGTMLTVITDFANELRRQVQSGTDDFIVLFQNGLYHTRKSLAHTTEQLEVLKKAGVVDAGAQGFVDLLEGIVEFMTKGSIREVPEADADNMEDDEEAFAGEEVDLRHRYCTECMITGENIDRLALRQQLVEIGSSLVIAGTRKKARIHVHVNNPDDAFRICEGHGELSSQKADDMQSQQKSAHRQRTEVAIITDSGSDIPDSELERLNIHIVPLRVNFGDRDYLDKVSLSPEEFYERMRTLPDAPKTSQPPTGDFKRQFQFLCSHHKKVISINLSSEMSGTLRSAQTAAESVSQYLTTFDSHNVSTGQGLLVIYAAELAQAGYPAEEILQKVEAMRDKTKIFAVIRDLSYGVRGGRIPPSKKRMADWLHLTPVITNSLDGRVVSKGVLFGRHQLAAKFANYLRKPFSESDEWSVIIGHWDCLDSAKNLEAELRKRVNGIKSFHLMDGGTAVGAHAGLGAMVVGLQPWEKIVPYKENG